MSPLVISAVIVAEGDSSIRVIRLWTSACSTVAIAASGTLTAVPTGSAFSASTEVETAGVEPEHEVDRLGVAELDPADGRRRQRGPDLGADLGRRESDADRLVRVDPDLDLRRGLDEVARDVLEPLLASPARTRPPAPSWATTASSSALTTTLRVLLDAAALHAGGRPRSRRSRPADRLRREGIDLRLEVDRLVEADDHRGAVRGAAELGGEDRLETDVAVAREGRRDELDVGIGQEDGLGLLGPLEDLLGGRAARRRDRDLGDLLRARVDERRRKLVRRARSRRRRGPPRRGPCRPASRRLLSTHRIAGS